jgi:ABC-2 type transport system permease protein
MHGTLEMLMSFPLTDWEVVVGKFLAAVALVAVALGLTLPFALFVKAYGPLDWGPTIGGYLGLLLMAAAYVGIGVMASVWTKNQIIAAIVSFVICFALYLSGKLLTVVPPSVAPILQAISLDYHFQSIARGVIDTRDLLYYLTLMGVSLVIAEASLASRRWR